MNHYAQNPGKYVASHFANSRKQNLSIQSLRAKVPIRWDGRSKVIASKVSRYGASSPNEFVAETFAGIVLGKTYSADVMSLYDDLGGPKPVRKN